jgi:hypothetical protein
VTFAVTVADGQLNLRFKDNGGIDPNWALNALVIRTQSSLPTGGRFDFGTSTSPVASGYTQVSPVTSYSVLTGYGWSSTAGLDSRDRGTPDDLKRDFVL